MVAETMVWPEEKIEEPQPKRWSLEEYHELIETGFLAQRRIQLLEGELVEMSPMRHPHAWALTKADNRLRKLFGENFYVRTQMPIIVPPSSEPEPDIAIFRGSLEHDPGEHPTNPVLLVEISDSTLRTDRSLKVRLYASIEAPEYWIVNLPSRQLEVFREPVTDEQGARFLFSQVLAEGDSVQPLHANSPLTVRELLP